MQSYLLIIYLRHQKSHSNFFRTWLMMFCTVGTIRDISSSCQQNLDFYNYFFVSNNIAQVKETRRPNNAGASTIPLPVTIKNTQRIKANNKEIIMIFFFIVKYPFWKLLKLT
jgi:hypothetical protein